ALMAEYNREIAARELRARLDGLRSRPIGAAPRGTVGAAVEHREDVPDMTNVPADILTDDAIAEVVSSYMRSIERGHADEAAALFADNAIFHIPVGGDVYRRKEEIRAAYREWLDGYKPEVGMVSLNAAGGEAAVHFQVSQDGQRIDVIDVITFDQEARM